MVFRYKYFEKLNGKMEFIGYFNLIDLKKKEMCFMMFRILRLKQF